MIEKTKHQIGKEHSHEIIDLLSGYEKFMFYNIEQGFSVKDYWQFQFSNMIDNLGYVAEFLIAKALGKEKPENCNGWTVYDLEYEGKRIEVKATSYYQSWKESHAISEQRTFSIRKTHVKYQDSATEMIRQNDIYIFCLLNGKTKEEANPLKLENWEFYIVPTSVINELCGNQKTISLGRIQKITGMQEGISYDRIKQEVDLAIV